MGNSIRHKLVKMLILGRYQIHFGEIYRRFSEWCFDIHIPTARTDQQNALKRDCIYTIDILLFFSIKKV